MANSLTVATKTLFPSGTLKVVQRTGTTTNVALSGTYAGGGTPANIEASWQGASYVTLTSPTIAGGNWSATLASQAAGDGTLNLRWTNDTSATATTRLSIGDVFVSWGDSTSVDGPLSESVTVTTPIWEWYDAGVEWMPAQSHQWAWFAQQLAANRGYPVIMINEGSSGTKVTDWQPGQSAYNTLITQVTATGVTGVKACIGHITLNDYHEGSTLSSALVKSGIEAIRNGFAADLPGAPPTRVALWADRDPTAYTGGASGAPYRTDGETIRQGLLNLYAADPTTRGANITGRFYVGDHSHHHTASNPTLEAQIEGQRWYVRELEASYGGTVHAPRLSSVTLDSTKKIVRATFDQNRSNTATSAVAGYRVMDNGTAVTVTSQIATSARVDTLTLPTAIAGTGTVSWASAEDAVNVTWPVATVSLPDTTAGFSTVDVPIEPFFNVATTDYVPPGGRFSTVFAGAVR